jgi:hypothetical protein
MTVPFIVQNTYLGPINGWITPTLDAPHSYKGNVEAARCVIVGVTGTLIIVDGNGDTVTLPNVQAGIVHYIVSKQINTGSTATGLLVGY